MYKIVACVTGRLKLFCLSFFQFEEFAAWFVSSSGVHDVGSTAFSVQKAKEVGYNVGMRADAPIGRLVAAGDDVGAQVNTAIDHFIKEVNSAGGASGKPFVEWGVEEVAAWMR